MLVPIPIPNIPPSKMKIARELTAQFTKTDKSNAYFTRFLSPLICNTGDKTTLQARGIMPVDKPKK